MSAEIIQKAWIMVVKGYLAGADKIINNLFPPDSKPLIPKTTSELPPLKGKTDERKMKYTERTEFFLKANFWIIIRVKG